MLGAWPMDFDNLVFYGGCVRWNGWQRASPLRGWLLHAGGRPVELGNLIFEGGWVCGWGEGPKASPLRGWLLHAGGRPMGFGNLVLKGRFSPEASGALRRSAGQAVARISRFTNCPITEAHVV